MVMDILLAFLDLMSSLITGIFLSILLFLSRALFKQGFFRFSHSYFNHLLQLTPHVFTRLVSTSLKTHPSYPQHGDRKNDSCFENQFLLRYCSPDCGFHKSPCSGSGCSFLDNRCFCYLIKRKVRRSGEHK